MRVRIDRLAGGDLAELRDWYEAQESGLGNQFLATVAEALARFEKIDARSLRRVKGPFRRLLVPKFHVALFFIVEGEIAVVKVAADQRRHPREVRRKLRRGDA